MKRIKRHISGIMLLLSFALVLVSAWSVNTSLAYFTTYAAAKGSHTLALGTQTTLHEKIKGMEKHIQIENTGGTECYVRIKIFAGSKVGLSCRGDGWSLDADGYWYYSGAVAPGDFTESLIISITAPEGEDEKEFDVVVIQECTPVLYDENGKAYGNWNLCMDPAGKEASQ